MTQRRLRQANLFGPAGFVSADDGEVIEFSQEAFESKPQHRTLAELGGADGRLHPSHIAAVRCAHTMPPRTRERMGKRCFLPRVILL